MHEITIDSFKSVEVQGRQGLKEEEIRNFNEHPISMISGFSPPSITASTTVRMGNEEKSFVDLTSIKEGDETIILQPCTPATQKVKKGVFSIKF